MSYILGLNAFHGDASACLLKNGDIVAAAEEERFNRIKHWAGVPVKATKYCLDEAGIKLSDVSVIALNQNSWSALHKKIAYTITRRPDLSFVLSRLKNRRARTDIASILSNELECDFKGQLRHIEHHKCHLAAGFYFSPFESSSVLSVDGFGDFSSMAWGFGEGASVNVEKRVHFPHSLGVFYQALTQYLGFPNYGDEYKVMGLAPYGKPAYVSQLERIVAIQTDGTFKLDLSYFRHHTDDLSFQWEAGAPKFDRLFSDKLTEELGSPRDSRSPVTQIHMDLAHSIQKVYEEALIAMLEVLHKRHQSDNICLSGGCAMNSVANGKIKRRTKFKNVFIQPAAGDAGGALGAAISLAISMGHERTRIQNAYFGPGFSNEAIESDIKSALALSDEEFQVSQVSDADELCSTVAEKISTGAVIGWFQGRMEWGPRALGNRSILGDPRRQDMKDILNKKIKRRESFRPFAPSILAHAVSDWFEVDDTVPFMMKVYKFRSDKRSLVPAVCHVDGTGRLQTVERDQNAIYFKLIEKFEQVTGVPMLLNTSFNENEPIVCNPNEAIDCFMRTKMDCLVLGNWIIQRQT